MKIKNNIGIKVKKHGVTYILDKKKDNLNDSCANYCDAHHICLEMIECLKNKAFIERITFRKET